MVRSTIRKILIRAVFMLADTIGFWRYPSDRPHNARKDRIARLYWSYKSRRPVIRAEKDSGIEAYFAEKQGQADEPLLPEGFQSERVVSVSAVGDLMCAPGLENSRGKFYAKVAELIFHADISFANLESTVIDIGNHQKGLQVNVTDDEFDVFKGHNGRRQYTVFSTANNHMLDGGMNGIEATHDKLEAEGIRFVGTNRSRANQKEGLVFDSNDIKFGFVGATFGVNKPFPQNKDFLVNVVPFHRFKENTDLSLLEKQMAWCRSQSCDFVIVSLHWGLEFEFFPRSYQVDIAHQLIECGADALISHHTHNLQPYEIYQTRRDPDRKVPIFYGLGNLSSWCLAAYRSLSLITRLSVAKDCIDGVEKTLVADVSMIPVLQMEYESNGTPYLQLEVLGDLMESSQDSSKRVFINTAAFYADLILGRSWREKKIGSTIDKGVSESMGC